MRFYTIGHSTLTFSDFLALLTGAGIEHLVDVRRIPHSRRHPQFEAEELARALRSSGIHYSHAPDLGGRRNRTAHVPDGQNAFWRNASFRNYADYAMSAPFQDALHALVQLGNQETCAIMCAEAVWWRCHRRIITDYLIHHGAEVMHIMGMGRWSPAALNPAATLREDGTLDYRL